EFEVLAEPRAGLFGRLRSEARVRARVQPTAVRPKVDRGTRRRGRKDRPSNDGSGPAGDEGAVGGDDDHAAAPSAASSASSGSPAGRSGSRTGGRAGGSGGDAPPGAATAVPVQPPHPGRPAR